MKTTISHTRYDWLLDPEPPAIFATVEHSTPKVAIPLPADIGTGFFSSIQLPLNIFIRRVSHTFKPEAAGQLYSYTSVCEDYTEPVLIAHAIKCGRIIFDDGILNKEFICGASNNFFRHMDKLISLPKLDTSEDSELTVLIIGDSVLRGLLGDEQTCNLLESLQITAVPSAAVSLIPHHISAILHASMPDHLTGNIRTLFAQAKVLEYICAIAEHFAGNKVKKQQRNVKKKLMERLYEELEQLEGKVPTLDELGRQYGMSARALNDEFKAVYGVSIYTHISELRLNEAHEALLQTTIPMKILAMNMGYSHVNNFISAFGKKFGYSPGSLRKK